MEDKPKIDLKQHTVKRVSRLYILKIFFYILLLAGILVYYFSQSGNKDEKKEVEDVKEIRNITIGE
ncbi:MAG: flagellar basal body-associated protein FliL [Crocinitomicaceae bacterium]|jgi:flagellar basal body-associated protein FliL